MAALSPQELAQVVVNAITDGSVSGSGLSRWDTAYAVARAESGGRPDAVGDGGNSFGLWQIYVPAHPAYSPSWLVDPVNNSRAMAAISNNGWSWTPWCTWDAPACGGAGNGSYRAYLGEAQTALAPFRQPVPPPPPPVPPPVPPPGPPPYQLSSTDAYLLLVGGAALLLAARR